MPRRRQSHEPGHRRKFIVVIDDTVECDRAVHYAARRAARTGGAVVMLSVLELADVQSQWLGVADLMRAEATDKAEQRQEHFAARARALAGVECERVIAEGKIDEEIMKQIEADEDIAILVLATGTGNEGPGPLVTALASGSWAGLAVPITIVPGGLTDSEIDALA
ncbi:universal stress protein [Ancylobacter pratisalsi]|uniref:Universal stress protein n=1 Tax=Ancylobacter pratisalsi TaxID=1745854 RepID=A0A6P1YKK4_9HYPH|nr:universal stress protein [Ancylobacter pratisalsi]QIB33858.1 universal stress protein [Ancylobacter pratisalsi]